MTTQLAHPIGKITQDGFPFDMYPLRPGMNRVDITYPAGGTATITPKSTKDPNNNDTPASVMVDGEALVITATNQFQIMGPGWLCFNVADFASDPIEVFISR